MQNKILPIVIFIIIATAITLSSSAFIIPEGRQAVVTQFGKPIRNVNQAGLNFKVPFMQDVRMIDLRLLSWDGYPNQIPTKDKKYIEVDTTARWQIVDPLKFIQTVQNERGARSRLDAILDGITRDVISGHNLVEAVRNSNNIIDLIEKKKQEKSNQTDSKNDDDLPITVEEEVSGEIEQIKIGREKLSEIIVERAAKELAPLGIKLIDVQLKRIAYETSVQKKVYSRMISERQRIAEKIRSYGKGERAKIEGKTQKDLELIQSEAYRKVQNIKGKAEAESFGIYAKTMNKGPEFYHFTRSLEAYEKSLPKNSKLILSTNSNFWNIFYSGEAKK